MLQLTTPRGLPVDVPEVPAENVSPRFVPSDSAQIKAYYEDNGYVIVKRVFEPDVVDIQRALWDSEVKPFKGYIYRQATARAERHIFNRNGWVMNPILNLQSVDPRHFSKFRAHATESILAAPALRVLFEVLLAEPPKVVQSMYFEGNSATWEHQDSYYLDSEVVGEMAAAWIAVESIAPRAGRFFVCPKSHKIRLDDHNLENNIVEHHEVYIASVVARIKSLELEIRAPALEKGDVLFWNARTIHGSLDSQDPIQSRSSITCHAIPRSRWFLSHQNRRRNIRTDEVNGTRVFRPKDLDHIRNRMVLRIESSFPTLFYWAKRTVLRRRFRLKTS